MSSVEDNGCECTWFDEGDWVVSKLNSEIIGIVVGNADFGRFVNVQLVVSLEVRPFYAVTLRHIARDTPPAPAKTADNVIPVDFTKGRVLRPDTNTEGAA